MNMPVSQKFGAALKKALFGAAVFAITNFVGLPLIIGATLIFILLMIVLIYIFRKIFLNQEVFERFLRLITELMSNRGSK